MIKAMRKNEKGFTLVELVVVIAILAILALLLVPRIMGNVRDSERSKDIANARTIASEIASHNALQSTTDATSDAIPQGTYNSESIPANDNLGKIGRSISDLPNKEHAEIIVDEDGNATVDVKPTPTP